MSHDEPATRDLLARFRRLLERSNEKLGEILDESRLDGIREWTREQFSKGARKLPALEETGKRVDRLLERLLESTRGLQQKAEQARERRDAGRLPASRASGQAGSQESLPARAGAHARYPEVGQEQSELDVQVSKFDTARAEEVAEEARTLPWSYGKTRATAMFVDADRLFIYWEVTDPAIEAARVGLGPGGSNAWLNLRVYDVTGRLFDGTNAHSYFDHRIERTDRQWFFHIGKPGSSAIVELGMKSREGYFVKIVRSGRVDFPRREPSAAADVEWLTVRPETGEIAHQVTEHRPPWRGFGGGEGPPISVVDWDAGRGHGWSNGEGRAVALLPARPSRGAGIRNVVFPGDWQEIRRTMSWEGPLVRTSWEAGPFFVPVELPSRIEEYHTGDVRITSRDGATRVLYGPWRVVIRGLGARAERQLLGVWEMTRTWTEGPARLTTTRWAEGRLGSRGGAPRDPGRARSSPVEQARYCSRSERSPARRGVGGVLPRRERGAARRRQRDALPRGERGPAAWGRRIRLGGATEWSSVVRASRLLPVPAKRWGSARASSAWRVRARCPSAAVARRVSRATHQSSRCAPARAAAEPRTTSRSLKNWARGVDS